MNRIINILLFAIFVPSCGMGFNDEGNVLDPPGSDAGADAEAFDGAVPCSVEGYREGCPCFDSGIIIDCGTIYIQNGSYTTCMEGYTICSDAEWGPCKGNHYLFH
ncbi:MAG: hypothetical protein ACOYO1_05175 [Bacteroidales bacterium]